MAFHGSFIFLQTNIILLPAFVFPHALFLFIYALSSFASIRLLFLSSKVHKDKGMWLYLFIASWGAFSSVTAFSLHELQGFVPVLLTLKSMYFSGYRLPFRGGEAFALPSVILSDRTGLWPARTWKIQLEQEEFPPQSWAQKHGLKPSIKIARSKCICLTPEQGNRVLHVSAWLLKTSLSPFFIDIFLKGQKCGYKTTAMGWNLCMPFDDEEEKAHQLNF